jgi:hypothetical protein
MPKLLPWERYRDILFTRYITEDRPLIEVMKIMEHDYQFVAR